MEKKSDCEPAIRYLCTEWAKESGIPLKPDVQPSFSEVTSWLGQKGCADYLNFRSVMGPLSDAEMWFAREFGQTWRN
jgi:hypothetical protein